MVFEGKAGEVEGGVLECWSFYLFRKIDQFKYDIAF